MSGGRVEASPLERLLEVWIERDLEGEHNGGEGGVRDARELAVELGLAEELTEAQLEELLGRFAATRREYEMLRRDLSAPGSAKPAAAASSEPAEPGPAERGVELPSFEGFRTIELLGRGGGGEVYKLFDERLERMVAGKVLRREGELGGSVREFLEEARSLALFDDPRIARVLDLRIELDPPVLVMEHVEGFDLSRVGRSLPDPQLAGMLAEVARAVDHAHRLGVVHGDLKPSNIRVGAELEPKILDFGLATRLGDRERIRLRGTLAYMAPERLVPEAPIDARADVYSLGVVLYQLLCGTLPYQGASDEAQIAAIREGIPRLPIELAPRVAEPLQAIALQAMSREPGDRYASANELALDLERFRDGRPVLARPVLYQATLAERLRGHLEQIREWSRLKLIYRHEAAALESAYGRLEARDEDWIVQSRRLTPWRISLYLGVFVLVCGALLYLAAYVEGAVEGVAAPLVVLVPPLVALGAGAAWLFRRDARAVAVAFFMASVALVPILLLIALRETGIWPAAAGDADQLFLDGPFSNRQLQVAGLLTSAWCLALAYRTRTVALSSSLLITAFLLDLALLADLGLRSWLEEENLDRLAVHLLPFLAIAWIAGVLADRSRAPWFCRPLYVGAASLGVLIVELMAQDGEVFRHLGLTLEALRPEDVSHERLLETVVTMVANGVLIALAASLLERRGSLAMLPAARLLVVVAPFAMLKPLGYLSAVGEYSVRWDWLYLGLSLAVAFWSHLRERRSFYYAGVINSGFALYFLTVHNEWWDRPAWGTSVLTVALLLLALGLVLFRRERRQHG
ncbi:MAG TPA: serine/threonine-protein kinase [Thermoanaerobaculia bacterium]|nr:serine/threonine-protein kinase [Thermoanaerobaculia bacterium]